ncbi:MAG: hypothetical protein AAF628_35260 [Planctomycetota bacterium]
MRSLSTLWAVPLLLGSTLAQTPQANFSTYGTGCAGSSGVTPAIGRTGIPSLGETFSIEQNQALGGTPAFLVLGRSATSLPVLGCQLLVTPEAVLPTVTSGSGPATGTSSFSFDVPQLGGIAGQKLYAQWVTLDAAGPEGVSMSDAGEITFGAEPQLLINSIVGPMSGGAGTTIDIRGQNFGTDPERFCVRGDDGAGNTFFFFPESITQVGGEDVLRVRLATVPPGGASGTVMMQRGRNRDPVVSGSSGMTGPVEEFGWDSLGIPENQAVVGTFTATTSRLATTIAYYPFVKPSGQNYLEACVPVDDPFGGGTFWLKRTRLTSDAHWNMTCPGLGGTIHYDHYLQTVTLVSPAYDGVAVGRDHGRQIDSIFDAKYGLAPGINVTSAFDSTCFGGTGGVRVRIEPVDPACTILGGGGNIIVQGPAGDPDQALTVHTGVGVTCPPGTLEVVDESGLVRSATLSSSANDVASSPDGRIAVVAIGGLLCPTAELQFWDVAAAPFLLGTYGPLPFDLPIIDVTPQGYVLVASGAGSPQILSVDVASRTKIDELTLATSVCMIEASPTGQLALAASSSSSIIEMINVQPDGTLGQPLSPQIFNGFAVNGLTFNPIGTQVVVANKAASINVYRVNPGPFLSMAQAPFPIPGAPAYLESESIQFTSDCLQTYVLLSSLGLDRFLIELDVDPMFWTVSAVTPRSITVPNSSLLAGSYPCRGSMAAVDGGDHLLIGDEGALQVVDTTGAALALQPTIPGGSFRGIDVRDN